MSNLFVHLAQRDYASRCLDLEKLKGRVPFDVASPGGEFKGRVVEVVFDLMATEQVNARFKAEGFILKGIADDASSKVIAVNEDESILFWGGMNSVYYLRKGERIDGVFGNIVFEDIARLVRPFNFKHKKPEIDAMIEALKKKYTPAV